MSRFALIATVVLILSLQSIGCQQSSEKTGASANGAPSDLAFLVQCMTGTFSSEAQSLADPDNFYNIRLVMVPIWEDRSDAHWLYVEQAAAEALDRPYRQRVYRITQPDNTTFQSDVYTLPGDPIVYAGVWSELNPLHELSPTDLQLRDGCSILLRKTGSGEFSGSTVGNGCASTLRGAAYATSEVNIRADVLTSWDRGFDANGEQVWGATEGPYIFNRVVTD